MLWVIDNWDGVHDGAVHTLHEIARRLRGRVSLRVLTLDYPDRRTHAGVDEETDEERRAREVALDVHDLDHVTIYRASGGAWGALCGVRYRCRCARTPSNIRAIMDIWEPDVVHVSAPSRLGAEWLAWARARGVPTLSVYHTDFPSFANDWIPSWAPLRCVAVPVAEAAIRALIAPIYRASDVTLVPTRRLEPPLRQMGASLVRTWGRGVDDAYRPSPGLTIGGVENTMRIIYVGRLTREKRVHMLPRMSSASVAFRWTVVGDGPCKSQLHIQCLPHVRFAGHCAPEKVIEHLQASDVLVCPSLSETYGQVVLEAMACGVWPVVCAGTSPADVCGAFGTRVSPAATPEDWAAMLKQLDVTRRRRGGEGCAAQRVAMSEWARTHTWSQRASEIADLYEGLIAPSAGAC